MTHTETEWQARERDLLEANNRLLERARTAEAINANLMGDDEAKPGYTTKRLRQEVERQTAHLTIENQCLKERNAALERGLWAPAAAADRASSGAICEWIATRGLNESQREAMLAIYFEVVPGDGFKIDTANDLVDMNFAIVTARGFRPTAFGFAVAICILDDQFEGQLDHPDFNRKDLIAKAQRRIEEGKQLKECEMSSSPTANPVAKFGWEGGTIFTENNFNAIADAAHAASRKAGWYSNADGSEKTRNIPEMLCLIHSEISEAMEGFRKDLPDDKLPHRKMIEVELADAIIRIGDLAGHLKLNVGAAIIEKMAFNERREDHKLEARGKPGGKAF